MYWLEDGLELNRILANANFRPSRLTITIRYSDWWWWESNEKLKMREDWLARFDGPPGLRELRVEYETLAWKKAELQAIVARNKKWRLGVRDGGHLSAEDTQLEEWCWTGPSDLGGQTWNHHGKELKYVVVTDIWKYAEGPIPEPTLREQEAYQPLQSDSDDAFDAAHTEDNGSEEDTEDDEA